MAAAACLESLARMRGTRPVLCREAVRTVGHPHLYDGSRAERELGLRYTPLRAAMEATVRWYVGQGLVTRRLPNLEGEQGTGGGSEPPPKPGGTAAA
jgi:dihydroflavonol-4-reductase